MRLKLLNIFAAALMWHTVLTAQQGLETHTPFPMPVLNSPFTAKRVTTTYQKLADGTQITHERTVLMARDSVGRTWFETPVQHNDALRPDGRNFTNWVLGDPITLTITSLV